MTASRDTLFISTDAGDAHADHVVRELTERGIPVFRFHPEDYPTRSTISVWHTGSELRAEVRNAFHEVTLDRVAMAWYRRPGPVQPHPGPPDLEEYSVRQATAAVRMLYRALEGRWLASPERLRVAEDKIQQLVAAARVGLRTPITCVSNDPDRVRRFRAQLPGPVAVKADHAQGVHWNGGFRFPLTTVWDGEASDDNIAASPSWYQEYVPKALEIRAVVVGDRVLAAEVDSQAVPAARHDVRNLPEEITYTAHELPDTVAGQLVSMTKHFGIRFASADLILTPDMEYVFLDLNPNGQWLWLEWDAGLPLTDELIRMMLTNA